MSKWHQGVFIPDNPHKYVGTQPIVWRSSWELTFMNVCDKHPNILQWASESIEIPYQHPITGRRHNYIPDFLLVYIDKHGNKRAELIEIKPASQAVYERAKSRKDKEAYIINEAKWKAAKIFCKKMGLTFRVMTEADLYRR